MESCNSFKKYKLNLHIVQGCVHYNTMCREVYKYANQPSTWLKDHHMDKEHKGSHGNANAETGFSGAGGGAEHNQGRSRAVAWSHNFLFLRLLGRHIDTHYIILHTLL